MAGKCAPAQPVFRRDERKRYLICIVCPCGTWESPAIPPSDAGALAEITAAHREHMASDG